MGSRAQRYYHLFFHSIRLFYLRLGPKQQHAITNFGWAPPRAASAYGPDGSEIALYDNDNGEDFLYMHRVMIEDVNRITKEINDPYGNVEGWVVVPSPGSKDWPVPAAYTIPDLQATTDMIAMFKTDDFFWDALKPREDALSDPTFLRTMTLGQLGARLENEIHFFLHNRFSEENSVGYRIQNPLTPLDYVDPKWDALAYNWLGDFYSAHVHPTFWMIHGWVENRIELWRRANNIDKITWIGTWEGGPAGSFESLADVSKIVEDPLPTASPSDTSDSSDNDDSIDQESLGAVIALLAKLAKK